MRVSSFAVVVTFFAVTVIGADVRAQDQRIVAFCDNLLLCGREGYASVCVANATEADTLARSVDNGVCSTYADLDLAWMGCVAELPCDELESGCAGEDGVRNDLEWQGATACGNGEAPVPPPSTWGCDPGNFNSGDGCDCGCNDADFDCGDGGCADGSCVADTCAFCHDDSGVEFDCYGAPPANAGADDPADDAGGCAEMPATPAIMGLFFLVALRRRKES